jgi:hypothetical protein
MKQQAPKPKLVPKDLLRNLVTYLKKSKTGESSMTGDDRELRVFSASAASDEWVAVTVSEQRLKIDLDGDDHFGEALLVVVRHRGCPGGERFCDKVFPEHEGTVLTEYGINVIDSKVRFLTTDPAAPKASTALRRVSNWLFSVLGVAETPSPKGTALLLIYDPKLEQPLTVARVRPEIPGHNPLREHPSGSTTFVSPAGRCVVDGEVIPVPSLCRPAAGGGGGCPSWASCKATDVVVATDLTTDRDGDGIPDMIKPWKPTKPVHLRGKDVD